MVTDLQINAAMRALARKHRTPEALAQAFHEYHQARWDELAAANPRDRLVRLMHSPADWLDIASAWLTYNR